MTSWDQAEFEEFFTAVNGGCPPYRWQRTLAEQLVTTGRWPSAIAAPTGAGKSSVVDIHVYALAATAGSEVCPPRRLCVAVNRRALVDSQVDRARRLAESLAGAEKGIVATIAERLRALSNQSLALRVLTMRGELPSDRSWVDDPLTVSVIGATPDMWGSRLLFRGYGTAQFARPREAGLLAIDAVLVLDEAHLNRQLLQTARDAGEMIAAQADALGRISPLQIVATTATPDGRDEDVLHVDLASVPVEDVALRRALIAPKKLHLFATSDAPVKGGATERYAEVIADEALALERDLGQSAVPSQTVLCVVNHVDTATRVAKRLAARVGDEAVECWVGRLRPIDLTELKIRRPGLFDLRGEGQVRFLVATQVVEVGIDMDCAGLVTELAPGAALTQRFGRVNRRGLRSSAPVTVVVPDREIQYGRPPYGEAELGAARRWLDELGEGANLSPAALADEPAPVASLGRTTLSDLTPGVIDLLAQTSNPLFAEPDLEFWLRDSLEQETEGVGFVVREGLPEDDNVTMALLEATEIDEQEIFPSSIAIAKRLTARVLAAEERGRVFRWQAGRLTQMTGAEELKPGDTVVVDDLHPLTRRRVVVADPDPGEPKQAITWGAPGVEVVLPTSAGHGGPLQQWLSDLVGLSAREAQGAFDTSRGDAKPKVEVVLPPEGIVGDDGRLPWLVLKPVELVAADDETRQLRSPGGRCAVPLDVHQRAVAVRAQDLAQRLGLDPNVVEAITTAGLHHDDGKIDAEFQAMLHGRGDDPDVPLAKSGELSAQTVHRRRGGRPWRHEQLSAAYIVARHPEHEERYLMTRLAGTSHGRGRPFFPSGADSLLRGECAADVVAAARDLFETGAGWADVLTVTDRRYGVWGTAFLEAVLRAADCQVSAEGS